MDEAGATLVEFLKSRRRFAEAPVESHETSLTLLLPWEAEFQHPFPSPAAAPSPTS